MKYSFLLDLIYKLHGSYNNFIEIVKKDISFIYDIRLDKTVYPDFNINVYNTQIPKYLREIDKTLINDTNNISQNIYKKYTYLTEYFGNNIIHEIFNDEKLFENYLKTYSFFNIFKKYINYDFLDIIYESFFIKKLQQNVKKIGIESSALDLITTLLNIDEDRIIYGNDLYRYVYLNDDSVKNKILIWIKDETLTDNELKNLCIQYFKYIKNIIKDEYNVNEEYEIEDNVTNLDQQQNRTILLDISTTYIFSHLTNTEQKVLIEFLNNFIPYYVKIILFDIVGDNKPDLLSVKDNVNVNIINLTQLLNIVGYGIVGNVMLANNKGDL